MIFVSNETRQIEPSHLSGQRDKGDGVVKIVKGFSFRNVVIFALVAALAGSALAGCGGQSGADGDGL